MNDQEKRAFEEAWGCEHSGEEEAQLHAMFWFNKGLEHARGQQEPVALSDEWTPCMKLPVVVHVRKQHEGEQHCSTREGITPVKPDDLIMRGISGEEYPIGREIFEQTYSTDINHPAQPVQPAAAINEQLLEALCKMTALYDAMGCPRGPCRILADGAIAAAEAAKGGV